ncbi:response regulator [Spongiactinospora sp. TRM90649]|uniref:response regulator n=1 Tax=Spongiactinospora sp. TRM90649 TaxID=3031114 RepID=UPI0023F9583C|nr:response regulator [Spongiactinospora sp. TRM90649]MDF5753067.1 response regulator [Spongiactinospora sp. TRM90649]
MRIRLVIADDHVMIRAGLRLVAENAGGIEVVGEAADGRQALAVTRAERPDVLLLDLMMPVMDGLQAARTLLADPEPPKIVMLTTFGGDENLDQALRAGVNGFLLKTSPPEHLVEAIRVAAGLDGLDALIAQVKDTGVTVGAEVRGRPRPLPPGLDLSAYRVVQEALTNALKHARAGRIDVTVTHAPGALILEVIDDGLGGTAGTGGHGLIGMRERVALYGGELSAGPSPGGRGYRVHARFPLA